MHDRPIDSPEVYRQLLKLTASKKKAIVAACDRDLRYAQVMNPHPAFREEDVLNKRDDEIAPPESVAELVAFKEEVLETGETRSRRLPIIVDGEERWYYVTGEPIRDADGSVVGVATAALDVTAQQEKKVFFEELSDRLSRQMMGITEHWHQELRTRTRLRPTNVFPGDDLLDGMPGVVGQLLHSLRNGKEPSPDSVDALRQVADHWKRSGFAVEEALLHFRILGDIIDGALEEAIEELGADVPPVYAASASQRICRGLNLIQVILVARYRDAEDERFANFGSNVVHEVRTHLGAAQTALQFIEYLDAQGESEGGEEERRGELLETARSSLELCAQLVDSLRELSQADALDGDDWDREALESIVTYVTEGVQEAQEEQARKIEVADEVPAVSVPEGPVSLILHNLIENAVKYADPDKPRRWVRLHFIREDDGSLLVRIGDNGIGIPETEQERIFERFRRGQQSRGEGFGLGLSIARQAARRIGSRLMLESEEGAGSTFSFTIPAEYVEGG